MKTVWIALLLLLPVSVVAAPLWSGDRGSVEVDQALLDRLLSGVESTFQLPVEGLVLDVQVEEVSEPNLGVTSLRGRMDDRGRAFFLLCRTDTGATVAFFQTTDGEAYRLDRTTGRDALRQVEPASLGSCGGGIDPSTFPGPEFSRDIPLERDPHRGSRDQSDDGSRQDILVAHTPRAEEYMGGWEQVRAECQLAIDSANIAYDLSDYPGELRLVHVMSTPYEESTAWDYLDHWIYLAVPDDDEMDDVLVMRDRVGADFVSLLIDGRDSLGEVRTCGIARVMQEGEVGPGFGPLAMSVVSIQCAAENWSLAHEVGHNRGCAHNREDASVLGPWSYGYGHRWFDDEGIGYRTIMSYDSAPEGEPAIHTRIPYLSNPDASYFGDPVGVPIGQVGEAHNAQVHINTTTVCAQFRTERTFVLWGFSGVPNGLFLTPFPSLSEGLSASRDGGAIVLLNDNPDFTGILELPRSYHADGGDPAVLGGN